MTDLLLSTKVEIPPPRADLVTRTHLCEFLNEGVVRRLTLVCAPAGFGKTTLFTEWHAVLGQDRRIAWLSLDEGDNDLTRFLNYLVASLDRIQPDLAGDTRILLQSVQKPKLEVLMTALINDLSHYREDIILALDDYHIITRPEINEALGFLLAHMPLSMHLVILTRSDPAIPLARLRANNQMIEIRAEHLRFSPDEAATFLNNRMGLSLAADDVQILVGRTEGWIAGLQLAALSLQGREDSPYFITDLSGGYHYIVDYLVEEVLDRQPESLQRFLLQTSILDQLNGPLCNAITGQTDGDAMLERLVNANLFLEQLGGESRFFRYHQLFLTVTRNLFQKQHPDQVHELHKRAARWYDQNNFIPEAIEHALAAKDWEYAADLIDNYCTITWRRGEVTRILNWADEIPKEVVFKYPRLSINYGWACVLTGRNDDCEIACAQIEYLIPDNPELQVDWLTVQAFLTRDRGQQDRAIELAKKAQKLPEVGNVDTRAMLMLSLSIALWDLGKIKESSEAAEEAVRFAEAAKNWHAWAIMHCFLGLAQAAYGNLHLAKEIYLRATKELPGVPEWIGGGFAQVCLAALFYEWNDLKQATEYALACLEYSQITAHSEIQMNGYRQLAFIYRAQGDYRKAWEILDQAEQVIQMHHIPRLWGPEHVQIAIAQDDIPKALHWINQIHGEYGAAIHYPAIPLERAKLALAQGDKAFAADLLHNSFSKASSDGIRYAQIEIRILQALATLDNDLAITFLSEALAWGQPEGFLRVFADQGAAIIPLLNIAKQRGIFPGYVNQILSAMEDFRHSSAHMKKRLTSPVSDRELEVLRLVAKGYSNQEIADELVIALGTVKRHVFNIFNKLDARNRTDCVTRAQKLNLL